jgi:hypothetical protein
MMESSSFKKNLGGPPEDEAAAAAYRTKETAFFFRGKTYYFALSHGLFSSGGVDAGSRLLLAAFSRLLDGLIKTGAELPSSVLDAGSGIGVLGVCAAGALFDAGARNLSVRFQDRDELARLFTLYNARKNSLGSGESGIRLKARTGPLLPPKKELSGCGLILTNIPAKAGTPVLEDFIRRAPALLSAGSPTEAGGMVLMVAVQTLGDFFRSKIEEAGWDLFLEEGNGEYRVFGFRPFPGGELSAADLSVPQTGAGFFSTHPAYLRGSGIHELEGSSFTIKAAFGAAGFDNPGAAVRAAAKLWIKLEGKKTPGTGTILIHEPNQGHFPVWLARSASLKGASLRFVLSGRNILSLEAAAENLLIAQESMRGKSENSPPVIIVPAVDPDIAAGRLWEAGGPFGIAVLFPEIVPQTNRNAACWEALSKLLEPGGLAIIVLPSSPADQFDRKKPKTFARLADIKREGFRAMAYRFL